MKVLLIGGGGREHAIAWKLCQSPKVTKLLCAPGNAGIQAIAQTFPHIAATDIDQILALAKQEAVDFVVVAPDDPLAQGLVDQLEAHGFPAFGPTAAAARIESSKVFSKAFMRKHGIPSAAYATFDQVEEAIAYLEKVGAPIVVKADGLALGKGVVMAHTLQEAIAAVRAMMQDGQFGASGARVVIEEWMSGPEVTQLAFCDGDHLQLMPSSQDHKRALDGDQGLNTGGMGAFAPTPFFTDALRERSMQEIFLPTLQALKDDGIPFQGVLYFGLMLTEHGPRVIEYNARFGDPETQAILPLLQSDLMDIFIACHDGTLDLLPIVWSEQCCTTVVVASGGYPLAYKTGYAIHGLDHAEEGGALVFHAGTVAGTAAQDGAVLTNGGRVLAVSALGDTLAQSIQEAYLGASCIHFTSQHMRRDIGKSVV